VSKEKMFRNSVRRRLRRRKTETLEAGDLAIGKTNGSFSDFDILSGDYLKIESTTSSPELFRISASFCPSGYAPVLSPW